MEGFAIRVLNLQFGAVECKVADEESGVRLSLDETAFRRFYDQTSTPLLRYLQAVTRKPDLAEDILQETYCRFLTARLPEMDERQARSYLFRIATNLMRDHWRGAKETTTESTERPVISLDFDARLNLRQAMDRLKPRERQLLWLAYVEGSNHNEIASSTGLRTGSIRMLLFRARRRLLGLLGAESSDRAEVTK